MMRSLEQFRLRDLARFEFGQLFKHGFSASHFERVRRLGETLKSRAERKRHNNVHWLCHYFSIWMGLLQIGILNSGRNEKIEKRHSFPRVASCLAASPRGSSAKSPDP